jgi:pimeloyl-ACP methyl ester carboxylesterase
LDYINEEPEVVGDPDFVRYFQEGTIYAGEGSNPVPAEFLDNIIAESLKAPFQTWQGALQGLLEEDHVQQLANITAPTLLMWGDQDAIFSSADQQALLDAIPGSTLITYENTGHAPHWERPDAFVTDLLSFLAQ